MSKCFQLVGLVTVVLGCASGVSSKHIRNSGEVLKEYEQSGHTFYVVRSGNFVRKWEQLENGAAGVLYEVDTVTRVCKSTNQVIECERLRGDADMAGFITW